MPSKLFVIPVLCILTLHQVWAAIIIHNGPSAVSHQSFTRLTAEPQQKVQLSLPVATIMSTPSPRIVSLDTRRIYENEQGEFRGAATQLSHTPAHLTFAARPVVHQSLPRPKPVRNISFSSLIPGPRNLVYEH